MFTLGWQLGLKKPFRQPDHRFPMEVISDLIKAQPHIPCFELPQVTLKIIKLTRFLELTSSSVGLNHRGDIGESVHVLQLAGPRELCEKLFRWLSAVRGASSLDDLRPSKLVQRATAVLTPPSLYSFDCTSTTTQEPSHLTYVWLERSVGHRHGRYPGRIGPRVSACDNCGEQRRLTASWGTEKPGANHNPSARSPWLASSDPGMALVVRGRVERRPSAFRLADDSSQDHR